MADGCQNSVSLTVSLRKGLYMIQPEGFVNPKDAKRYASSSDPSMDWCEPLGVGIHDLMR